MTEPLISVIVPSYNTSDFICNILDSLCNQTYKNLEVIIVDDGSDDNTIENAKSFLQNSKLNWQILNNSHQGVSVARNTGILHSKGEWIICPDSDDYLTHDAIEVLYKSALDNDALVSFCDYKNTNLSDVRKEKTYHSGIEVISKKEIFDLYFSRKIVWVIPATLIHSSVAKCLLFDTNTPYSEDTLYTWELLFNIPKVVHVKADMYNYFIREGSKQHSLTVEACLQSIASYNIRLNRLADNGLCDERVSKQVVAKFILGAFHVLARCQNYRDFIGARKKVSSYDLDVIKHTNDFKLKTFYTLFRDFPVCFYILSKQL